MDIGFIFPLKELRATQATDIGLCVFSVRDMDCVRYTDMPLARKVDTQTQSESG